MKNIKQHITEITRGQDPEILSVKAFGDEIRKVNAEILAQALIQHERTIKVLSPKSCVFSDITRDIAKAAKRIPTGMTQAIARQAIEPIMPAEIIVDFFSPGKRSAIIGSRSAEYMNIDDIEMIISNYEQDRHDYTAVALKMSILTKMALMSENRKLLLMMLGLEEYKLRALSIEGDWGASMKVASIVAEEFKKGLLMRFSLDKVLNEIIKEVVKSVKTSTPECGEGRNVRSLLKIREKIINSMR